MPKLGFTGPGPQEMTAQIPQMDLNISISHPVHVQIDITNVMALLMWLVFH